METMSMLIASTATTYPKQPAAFSLGTMIERSNARQRAGSRGSGFNVAEACKAMAGSRRAGALLIGVLLMLGGCTESEVKALDRMANGAAERQMRERVQASMAANQTKLLESFQSTCATYDSQPNEIKKSEVYRGSSSIYREVGQIKDWSGILRGISTDQGGSTATLRIHMGSSTVWDKEVRIGSNVYKAAAELSEDEPVLFSGRLLRDFNMTERGKVCSPSFLITLTAIRKLD